MAGSGLEKLVDGDFAANTKTPIAIVIVIDKTLAH
jgi:hypothetical protein